MNAQIEPIRGATDVHRPLRVLEVMGNAIVGGMETYVARLVERLPPARFTVTVLCPSESAITERLRSAGAEVMITPMPHDEAPWLSVQMTCALIRARSIDVLHAHLPNAHLLAGLAGALTARPVVTTIHGRQVTPLDIEVHRSASTHVSVVCQHSYFHALGMGIREAQLSCIPNGVDTELFRPADRASPGVAALRAELGAEGVAMLVGFVGRLSQEKGPELFLDALARLRGTRADLRAVIVGDGPMRAALQELAGKLGLAGCLRFAGVRDDMPQLYRALDVLVSSSHSEAMPLCVMEAMASGVPVVATRVGGVPELIDQGRTGFGVGARDAAGLAAQVAVLLDQPELRGGMGRQARDRAERLFGLEACVERTGELLKRLASQPAATAHDSRTRRAGPRGAETL